MPNERMIDHYPRTAPPLIDTSHHWHHPNDGEAGNWQHVCTTGECPVGQGHYFVTALDAGSLYYMAGPYNTHAEALALVNKARDIANKHDGRAWFMSWGTVRSSALNREVLRELV